MDHSHKLSNHRDGGRSHGGSGNRSELIGNDAKGGNGKNHFFDGGSYKRIGGKDQKMHERFPGSQEQYQYQQRQHLNDQHRRQQNRHDRLLNQREGGNGQANKRSRSPSLSHHYDSQQQQRHSNTPNNYYTPKPSHHGNTNFAYEEREDSAGVQRPRKQPQQNLPQPHLLSPNTSKQHHQPPPVVVAVPLEKRRTLILANIPSRIEYYHLKNFFQTKWNAPIQYCELDRSACEAYVVFKFVQDAQRVWIEGRKKEDGGLDGKDGDSGGKNEKSLENTVDNKSITSLVALGVELRAVHFSNHVGSNSESTAGREGGDINSSQGGKTDDYCGDEGGGGERSGGDGSYNDRRRNHSLCRSVSDGYGHSYHGRAQDGTELKDSQQQQQQQHLHHNARMEPSHVSPVSASMQSTPKTINNAYYHPRTPILSTNQQNEIQPSSIELQLQLQEEAEELAKWEAFQLEEMEWRKRRLVEYNNFIQAKNERSTQLSTLEQKRDLLSKQEDMLSQQLPLHKKMLAMLKSKNSPPSEQSAKMKEILCASKRIVELKTEIKEVIKDIEKVKEEELTLGVFRPSEKRPIFSGKVGGPNAKGSEKKRSLDRRTTMLKIQGFDDADNANEDAIMKQFSEFGTVASVSIEKCVSGGSEEAPTLVALINYENRIDAERAKSEITKLNGSLTCTWHCPSASAGSEDLSPDGKGNAPGSDGCDDDQGLYEDVYDGGEDNGEPYYNDENVDGDHGGEEDFVDYD